MDLLVWMLTFTITSMNPTVTMDAKLDPDAAQFVSLQQCLDHASVVNFDSSTKDYVICVPDKTYVPSTPPAPKPKIHS